MVLMKLKHNTSKKYVFQYPKITGLIMAPKSTDSMTLTSHLLFKVMTSTRTHTHI